MQFTRRHFIGAAVAASAGLSTAACVVGPRLARLPAPAGPPPPVLPAVAAGTQPPLLQEALAALSAHGDRMLRRDRIAVADFSLASREARFHFVNVESGRIERTLLVAHGSGSDPGHTGVLQHFSNTPGSNATSRGAYLTSETYQGKYGTSQRLIGLERHNDMALDRAIVVHGAPYVDPGLIAAQGRIGRSQGCFAVELHEIGAVLEFLGQGRMIYATKTA